MHKQPGLYYYISLGALAVFLVATAFFGVSVAAQPVVFEGLALAIFLPLTVALFLDWRFRKVFLGRFLIKIIVSAICLAHCIVLAGLLVGYVHV